MLLICDPFLWMDSIPRWELRVEQVEYVSMINPRNYCAVVFDGIPREDGFGTSLCV